MSQFSHRLVVWFVVLLLLLVGIVLQVRSARGTTFANPPDIAAGASLGAIPFFRF
jgi:hypothetical protein